jgi:hypothetical protein
MPKFTVTGREVVYYLKVVEAESVQDVKDQWLSGASYFDAVDIEETADFSLGDIEQHEEMKKYKVKVSFIGHKYYDIEAEDKKQACQLAEDLGNDSGLTESEIGMVQAVEVEEVTIES